MGTTAAEAVIRAWLREHVTGNREIPDDYPLIEQGLLTSLATLDLVLFLEERFGITIGDEEVSAERFRSIASIAALVAEKTA